ncbi:MAG: exopolysaccharide biosynthesis protein [Syntrophaceae bacterium]|nr:exopolysaccharide biosynthesis protein [Syntrophaceae bacterium]
MEHDFGLHNNTNNRKSLGEKLDAIIRNLPPDQVTLAEIRDLLGQEGLLLLTAFLTLVFLIPISIPGVSTVFGAAILLIGFSRLFNRSLWLPKQIRERQLPAAKLRIGLQKGLIWFHRLERISHPHRLNWINAKGLMAFINDCALILGAILLMAPFGLVPFSNTLPAIALLLLAIGLLERDGICILLGHLTNVATIFYFALLIAGGSFTLYELIQLI